MVLHCGQPERIGRFCQIAEHEAVSEGDLQGAQTGSCGRVGSSRGNFLTAAPVGYFAVYFGQIIPLRGEKALLPTCRIRA